MTRQQVLDIYFLDARHKLIEIAAFLDRLDRAGGDADFRLPAFRTALRLLDTATESRAPQLLMAFSDPTMDPIPKAPGKGACGAYPGREDAGTHGKSAAAATGVAAATPEPPPERGLQSAGSHADAGTVLRAKARAPRGFKVVAPGLRAKGTA